MELIQCRYEKHAAQILAILNEAIVSSTALYDYRERSEESMVGWFTAKQKSNFPVIGLEDANGILVGFASYGPFRVWPAYKYSVEHSIYIKKEARGTGLGTRLLTALIEQAKEQGYHLMVGGIDRSNEASVKLHAKLGFAHAGTIHEVGFKFGAWLDLSFYTLVLPTPISPVDG
ncbi:MAG TPA: GNAT family N-acetyltransferase [Rhodocyclaceae bacterium]|nr:GNAT family N-acetyltransferase [Rhodocyclaceae bacterium]